MGNYFWPKKNEDYHLIALTVLTQLRLSRKHDGKLKGYVFSEPYDGVFEIRKPTGEVFYLDSRLTDIRESKNLNRYAKLELPDRSYIDIVSYEHLMNVIS